MSIIDKFILIFCIDSCFNLVIQIFKKCLILVDFSLNVSLFVRNSPIAICREIVIFSLFPCQFECLNSFKDKSSLIVGELPILTHGIKTYNELLFES